MYIKASILDDLMRNVFERLLKSKIQIPVTKGETKEISGALLELKNTNARLSRTETKGTLFSCLGELLWYLSGDNQLDFIQYYLPRYSEYSDDKITVHGGYGPRVFGKKRDGQFFRVLDILTKKQTSRQAVIQIFDELDLLKEYKDIPCTCTLQFIVREKKLHLSVTMRSNDAFKGLPHDIFAFTMFQEIMARSLSLETGQYKHYVGSLHLYLSDVVGVQKYIEEDWQSNIPMPRMPNGNPWPSIEKLLVVEKQLRLGESFDESIIETFEPYWADLVRILIVFSLTKKNEGSKSLMSARKYIKNISSDIYITYLKKRVEKLEKIQNQETPAIRQLDIFNQNDSVE